MPSHQERVRRANMRPRDYLASIDTTMRCPFDDAQCEYDRCIDRDPQCHINFEEACQRRLNQNAQ